MEELSPGDSAEGPGRTEAQRKEGNESFVKRKDNLTLAVMKKRKEHGAVDK